METRARKRQRIMENVELGLMRVPEEVEFMDLNDDVLYSIFGRLPLRDLCAIGRTCTRLQALAGNYFQRKYPNNRLDIEIFNYSCADGNNIKPKFDLRALPNEEYTEAFHQFIQNVGIFVYNYESDPIDAFQYLKNKCCDRLRELVLYRIRCHLDQYGELIKEQLEHLESIKFDNCYIRDIYSAFLQHSPNLKQITIKEGRNQNGVVMDWANHHYEHLKKFSYHSDNVNVETLDAFLTLNPQITNIVCSSTKFFRLLVRRSWRLELLSLCFNREVKFHMIANELEEYCHKGFVKRLDIHFLNGWEPSRFGIGRITELATLNVFQGLHCKQIAKKVNFPFTLEQFKQMKVLSFGIDTISRKLLQVLSHMPNLQELHVESSWTGDSICGCTFKNFITPFARYAPNLETIVLKGIENVNLITTDDFVAADRLRKRIPNAKVLTIYLDYKLIQAANLAATVGCRVQIKPISHLKPDYRKIY